MTSSQKLDRLMAKVRAHIVTVVDDAREQVRQLRMLQATEVAKAAAEHIAAGLVRGERHPFFRLEDASQPNDYYQTIGRFLFEARLNLIKIWSEESHEFMYVAYSGQMDEARKALGLERCRFIDSYGWNPYPARPD